MGKPRHSAAFSLSEILITLCLITFLGSWALPNFTAFLQAQRSQALTQLLAGHLAQARLHSALHQRDVELCGSSDSANCDNQWHKGWILRYPGDSLNLLDERLPANTNLRWRGATQRIRFHPDGTSPLGNGRFLICSKNDEVLHQVVINRQGRARIVNGLEAPQTPHVHCL